MGRASSAPVMRFSSASSDHGVAELEERPNSSREHMIYSGSAPGSLCVANGADVVPVDVRIPSALV